MDEISDKIKIIHPEDQTCIKVGEKTYRSKKAIIRRLRAYALRANGMTHAQVGAKFNCSMQRAAKLAKEGYEIYKEYFYEPPDMKKTMAVMKLESLLNFHMGRATDKDTANTKSPEIVLKAIKLLSDIEGTAAPQKVVNVNTSIEKLMEALGEE